MGLRRTIVAVLVALVAAAASGCGGDEKPRGVDPAVAAQEQRDTAAPVDDLALPDGVPQEETGPADRRQTRVIRAWLRALSRGDVERAARFFALPSKFQNGTPVLTIDSRVERLAINRSFPCGARAVHTGGAGSFTIVVFRLLERPGGACGPGTGEKARGAIRVTNGKIREWYRLPDGPQAPPAPAGPVV